MTRQCWSGRCSLTEEERSKLASQKVQQLYRQVGIVAGVISVLLESALYLAIMQKTGGRSQYAPHLTCELVVYVSFQLFFAIFLLLIQQGCSVKMSFHDAAVGLQNIWVGRNTPLFGMLSAIALFFVVQLSIWIEQYGVISEIAVLTDIHLIGASFLSCIVLPNLAMFFLNGELFKDD